MTTPRRIYLDYHATTPLDPRALAAMRPYLEERFGNASSRHHAFGWEANEGVERARAQVARLIGARPGEVVFTAGATEADNLAIQGVLEFHRDRGDHIVTVVTEHRAVLDTCAALARRGMARVTTLPVDAHGRVDVERVRQALTDKTVLVSVMAANNEIGAIHPIAEIGRLAKERGVFFHCDAAQGLGKIPLDVEALGIDLLSGSAHKLCGPKGVGVLYVRSRNPRVRLAPLFHGGGQERGLRSGTLNVAGIVGFGAAAEIAAAEMPAETERVAGLRDRLRDGIMAQLDQVYVNGPPAERLPGNINLSFAHVEGESLLMGLNGAPHSDQVVIAVSSGSACTSATLEPSYVLRALKVSDELAHSSIRFGLGRFTTVEEIDLAIERVVAEVRRLRRLSPFYTAARPLAAAVETAPPPGDGSVVRGSS
jgi:cysteine desulfurase